MLDATLKAQLQGYLAKLAQPVEIIASLDESDTGRQMRGLLEELASLDPRIGLQYQRDESDLSPAFSLRQPGREPHVRFAGVPLGHEFSSLVLALLQAGGHPPKVPSELVERIRALRGPLEFQTVVSLSCQSCPDVVQALNLMAVINPAIRHTMIDGAAFPEEVERRQVLAVPAVFLNDAPFAQGRMELADIVERLDRGGERAARVALADKAPYEVLVVGGGPAGAAAAIYAARKGIRTGLVAERLGGQLLDTQGIENFISIKETQGHTLAAGLDEHVATYAVDVMSRERAKALVPGGEFLELELASGARLRARSIVIATGARWREINVPGEQTYRNRGVAYCPHCDGPLFKGKDVAVIGGGNSGVEAVIDLAGLVRQVTLIEYEPRLRADAVLLAKLRSLPNVKVLTGAQTTEIRGDGERVTGLRFIDRASGEQRELALAGVFVQIGLVPNTDWLKGTVALSARGEIEVDARGQTSLAGVFAAGDCTIVPYKQIVIAVGEGAKAALGAFDHLIRTPLAAAA